MVLLTCAGGVVGNVLVVWLLGSQGQRSPFSVYVVHPGVADLLFLLCMASTAILNCVRLGAAGHTALETVSGGMYCAHTAGLSLRAAISARRCLSVLSPPGASVGGRAPVGRGARPALGAAPPAQHAGRVLLQRILGLGRAALLHD